MQRKDVDKIVQDSLKNYKPEFKEDFWADMEQALDEAENKKSSRKPLFVWLSMLLVAVSALGILFIKNNNQAEQQAIQQKDVHAIHADNKLPAETKVNYNYNTENNKYNNIRESDNSVSANASNNSGNSINSAEKNLNSNTNPVNKEAAGFNNNNNTIALTEAEIKNKNTSVVNTYRKAFSKKAETRYFLKKKAINPENPSNNDVVTSGDKNITENNILNNATAQTAENNNSLIEASDVPALLAESGEQELQEIKVEDKEELLAEGGKQNSLDLTEKEEKAKKGTSAANWQSIMYHFRDNAAYTGNEAKYNFNTDTRHTIYEDFGALESRYNFSFDTRIEKLHSSVGVYHQRTLRSLSFATTNGISYAYNIKTDPNGELRLGVGVAQQNKWLYVNSFKYSDQIEPGYGFIFKTNDRNVMPKTTSYNADAGIWYQRPKWMLGISAKNLYASKPVNYEIPATPKEYVIAGGYRFDLGKQLQLMPWVEAHRYDPLYWFNSSLLLTWKDKFMFGAAYQNVNPYVGYGDVSLFAGVEIKNSLRIHASVGRSSEWMDSGIKQDIFQAGIRYQIR